jgi:hypothetical protein
MGGAVWAAHGLYMGGLWALVWGPWAGLKGRGRAQGP